MGKTNKKVKIEIDEPKKRMYTGKQRSEIFADRRTKRKKTRGDKNRSAIEESRNDRES